MTNPIGLTAGTGRHRARRVATSLTATLTVATLAVATLTGCLGVGDENPPATGGDRGDVLTERTADAATPTTDAESSGETSALPDACALVSKQEAEKLAATPLEDGRRVHDTCTYTAPVTGPTGQVEVYVGDSVKQLLDTERELGKDLKPLTGIGDEAYAEDGVVFIGKSGVWVSIRLVRTDDMAKYRKPLEDLARTVAGRL